MTIEKRLEELCVEHGLFPAQAEKAVAACKMEVDADMNRRWQHDVSDYPSQMLTVLWLITKTHALAYIDENEPKHWARPNFET